jgi:hypothetical protein
MVESTCRCPCRSCNKGSRRCILFFSEVAEGQWLQPRSKDGPGAEHRRHRRACERRAHARYAGRPIEQSNRCGAEPRRTCAAADELTNHSWVGNRRSVPVPPIRLSLNRLSPTLCGPGREGWLHANLTLSHPSDLPTSVHLHPAGCVPTLPPPAPLPTLQNCCNANASCDTTT